MHHNGKYARVCNIVHNCHYFNYKIQNNSLICQKGSKIIQMNEQAVVIMNKNLYATQIILYFYYQEYRIKNPKLRVICIFRVAFLAFQVPARSSHHVPHSLTLE